MYLISVEEYLVGVIRSFKILYKIYILKNYTKISDIDVDINYYK